MTAAPFAYPPLPSRPDAAAQALQQHIDRHHAMLAPDGAAALLSDMVDSVGVQASGEYLAQRAKLAELGLDPDVLAPLPVDHKPVAYMAEILTYPESSVRAWLAASGFDDQQIIEIVSQLRFAPEGLDEALDAIEDRTEVVDGRVLDVDVRRSRRQAKHPLLVDQSQGGTPADDDKPRRPRDGRR